MTSIPVTLWAALSTVLCTRSTSTRVAAPCFQSTPLPKRRICRSPSLGAGCGRLIRRFHEVYAESTAPLADLYAERDLLVQVDGMGEIDVVTGRIMEALASRGITGS